MTDLQPGGRGLPVVRAGGRVTRYRVELPRAGIVPTGRGRFEATEYAERRAGWHGRWLNLRDRLLGTTLASHMLENEKLSKVKALAVFSSDALSSTAYATQEILFVLILAGAGAIKYSLPIALAITALLAVVIISYRQTVRAYPGGGGAYIVAHDNLGVKAGLIAASALLIDYVLTVAVSVAAGMDALASLNGGFRPFAVEMSVALVALVAVINLRGMKESGTIFAIPTYAFVLTLGLAIGVALTKILVGGGNPLAAGAPREQLQPTQSIGLFLLLRAFANGCTALTGVEAISNGVQAFKRPAWKNASQTLLTLGLILGALFLGVTVLARYYGFVPDENNTIPSQLGVEAFGDGSLLFAFLQIMTAGILILAANTAFADFPRLAAILARDGYMPRIFHARGNRLVFSTGIITLATLAGGLLIAFNAQTTRLIPLYALGVFLSFSLSQGGMVRHWWKRREPGWRRSMVINGVGGVVTTIVLAIILQAKFGEGAWIIVILIPVLAAVAGLIGVFYHRLHRALYVGPEVVLDFEPRGPSGIPIVVPVEEVNLAAVMALGAACERSRDVTALHVLIDPDEPSAVEERWGRQFPGIPLVVIDSPYRTAADPVAAYVVDRLSQSPHEVTVTVPVVEVRHMFQRPLVNQSLKRLGPLLGRRRHVNLETFPFTPGGRRRRKQPPM
ncbi:MAG: APC family permease [Chloroflexi bacterium]|nr:APC family permease [Chloroflexota bacterium]